MDFVTFFQVLSSNITQINQYFLKTLEKINSGDSTDLHLKMTQASILFEGFYHHLKNTDHRKILTDIRAKRWSEHFGVPTTTFLLTYKHQIDETKQLFDENKTTLEFDGPWLVSKNNEFLLDNDNHVFIDQKSISRIAIPENRETTGTFTKTHNPFGGFTTTPCDPVSQKFIEHAAFTSQHGGKVLEVGAAFGAATLEAIEKGATVFCNDINPENLAVVRKRLLETTGEDSHSITGDSPNLVLIPGELPNELIGLPKRFFDAILICRVLHFFSGEKIEQSLRLMSQLLAPGGKIYIVCETPYLKNWQRFIPEFNKRVEQQVQWPGEITNPADYESSGRAASLPTFVHWITQEVLERSLLSAGFAVEYSEYINRAGQFPQDLLLPEYGQESVGAIGVV